MPRALVTGSAGFVGRYVVRALLACGYHVRSLDLRDWVGELPPKHHFTRGDAVDYLLGDQHPEGYYDLTVHCAYRVGGRESIDGDRSNLVNNTLLDGAYFDYIGRKKPGFAVYFSSSAAYPVRLQTEELLGDRRLRETHIDPDMVETPDADYGWAKLNGERLARNALRLGHDVLVVRPFSGYGGDQDLTYPFPAFIQRVVERVNPFPIWGSATQRRDWIHITDVVNATLALVDARVTEPVNLCTGDGTALGDLALLMHEVAGVSAPTLHVQRDRPYGVHTRVGDPTVMLRYYTPRVSLVEGIQRALVRFREGEKK